MVSPAQNSVQLGRVCQKNFPVGLERGKRSFEGFFPLHGFGLQEIRACIGVGVDLFFNRVQVRLHRAVLIRREVFLDLILEPAYFDLYLLPGNSLLLEHANQEPQGQPQDQYRYEHQAGQLVLHGDRNRDRVLELIGQYAQFAY